MSGILGKLSFDQGEQLARPILEQMVEALAQSHDEQRAIHQSGGIALGLAAPQGRGVIHTSHADTVRVVADAPQMDTAAIAQAYTQFGTRAFARFSGPFAIAIWDDLRQRLVVARDHLGVRPLYYAILHDHGVVFATSLEALLHEPGVGRQWSPEGVDAYLTYGYVPAPLTLYRRVSKLEPGQLLVVEGRRFHIEQYWTITGPAEAGHSKSESKRTADEMHHAVDACVRRVIRRQAPSADALGVLYSGGVASSLLLAASPRHVGPAITVSPGDDTADLARSDAAAVSLGRVRQLEIMRTPMTLLATELASRLEEPVADPRIVTQFAIFAAAKHYADAALAGHGAGLLSAPLRPRRLWDDLHRHALYTRAFAWQVRDVNLVAGELQGARDLQVRSFLGDNVAASATRAAAVAGLELRFPFLDAEFVQTVVDADVSLRRLLGDYLPAPLLPRPIVTRTHHAWLHAALPGLMPSVLLTPRFDGRGIVSRPFLLQLWQEHQTRQRDHAHRLWSLIVLEYWFREFIDDDAADEPLEYAVVSSRRQGAPAGFTAQKAA